MSDYFKTFRAFSAKKAARSPSPTGGGPVASLRAGAGGVAKLGLSASKSSEGNAKGTRPPMLAGLSKVQSVGEKEKSVDVKEVGIEIQKVEDESNPIPSQSKGKSSDLRSLFYLKTEPGTTVCCTKIQTTGGDRVCSRMLNAAGKCSVAGHNKIDPVHLPYPALFVGGRGESFYIDSKACLPEAELGRVPQEDRVQLLKGQHTHAEWISQFSELRLAENAIGVLGGESVAILKRRLNFDDDEAALIKATITPSKGRSDEDVKGEDDDYVIFTNEVVQEMAVPNFVNKSGSVRMYTSRARSRPYCRWIGGPQWVLYPGGVQGNGCG